MQSGYSPSRGVSRISTTTATLASARHQNSAVDDIVSRYVLTATLPSERAARVSRSTTPTNVAMQRAVSPGLIHTPVLNEQTDRRADPQLQEMRTRVERSNRQAEEIVSTSREIDRYKSVLADLEQENVHLRTKVRSLTILVEEKENGLREMDNSLKKARQQLADTEEVRIQDMASLRKQINLLQKENNELAERCDNLRLTIATKDTETTGTREEMKIRLQQLEVQLETSRNTNFRLSHQLEEREHQLEELHRLQAEIPRLEAEAKDAIKRVQEAQKLTQQKEEEQVRLHEQHKSQLRALMEQMESWKREANRLSERGFEHHRLQTESGSRATQSDKEILQVLEETVRSGIDEMRRRQAEVERLQIDIHRLQDENRLLREAAAGKDFVLNEASMLKAQIRHLQENVSLIQQLNTDLKSQIEKKQSEAAIEASTHLAEIDGLKQQLVTAKSEAAALEKLKRENQKLRKEAQKAPASERVNELRAEKSVLEQEVSELREKLIGMTANAIQVERIYAEQIEELQKEVSQLRLKEADCKANHLNTEREAQLQTRTLEIEAENETLRLRMEANMKLQNEIEAERKKEAIKREQQSQLQQQLTSIAFAKPDAVNALPMPKSSSPRASFESSLPPNASEIYLQRLHRASSRESAQSAPPAANLNSNFTAFSSLTSSSHPPSPLHTEDVAAMRAVPSLLRMTSALDANGSLPSSQMPSPRTHNPPASASSLPPLPSATSTMNVPPVVDRTVSFGSQLRLKPDTTTSIQHSSSSIRYSSEGLGAVRFGTLPQLFLAAAETGGNNVAIKSEVRPHYVTSDGTLHGSAMGVLEWSELTWQAYYVKAAQFAKALISHRCEPNASIMVVVSTASTEGSIVFCGAALAGCLPTTAFPSAPITQLLRQAEEVAAEIVVVDDPQLLQKLINGTRRVTSIKQFVLCGASIPPHIKSEFGQMVATFDQFTALCAYVTDTMLQTRIEGQSVEQPACIVYTAGTTGDAKGVLLSHDNLQFAAAAIAHSLVLTDMDAVSHLALTSIAEAHGIVVNIILPMLTLASKSIPFVTHLPLYNREPHQLPWYTRAIRPTFLFAPPSIYHDFLLCIRATEDEVRTENDGKLLLWAKNIALEASLQRQRDVVNRGSSVPIKGAQLAASMTDKTKTALGLDRVVQTICVGGPASMALLETFASCGFDLLEVYASAETTGLATTSAEACFQFGFCGFHLPSTEVVIDPLTSGSGNAKEGELLIRGRHVMLGYLTHAGSPRRPDADGWLRTGDCGSVDRETGLVAVIGRLRDQVVVYPTGSLTNPSERISVSRVEDSIHRLCPALAHVTIFGDQRKFLVALMTLKAKRNPLTGGFTDDLVGDALDVNPEVLTVTTARRDEKWLKYIAGVIAQCNSNAETPSQKVKRFCILPTDYTVATGELTPSEKVKRSAVQVKYAALIEKLYAEDATQTPRK